MTDITPDSTDRDSALSLPLVSLIVANLATIVLALLQGWDIGTVICIYWFQSIVIGFFTVLRILSFPADRIVPSGEKGLRGGGLVPGMGRDVFTGPGAWFAKFFVACFFALHYGFFHAVYLAFLAALGFLQTVNFGDPDLLLACGIFVLNHLVSFLFYRHEEPGGPVGIREMVTEPYRRIFPMHLTIMLAVFASFAIPLGVGWYSSLLLVFFLAVKTWADVKGHVEKHRGQG